MLLKHKPFKPNHHFQVYFKPLQTQNKPYSLAHQQATGNDPISMFPPQQISTSTIKKCTEAEE
jgi:hypothetical protein